MHAKPMNLQQKLVDVIGAVNGEVCKITEMFGVEVELEGMGGIAKPTLEVNNLWAVHQDGSLRKMGPLDEAIEYVTRQPYDRAKTAAAVKVLMDFLNKPGLKVYDSYRTSIHVHVNCLADTQLHVCNFITLCLLFDELFVSQNGEHRIGNNFCLRAKDAQGQVVELIRSIEMNGNVFGVNPNHRYSSINFASLTKFGTVEFRSLECTTDPIRIMHWIRTIDYLKQASREFKDPQDIIRKFSQVSLHEFCYLVLGPQASKYIKVPGYEEMLFNGMRIAQEFAFCSKWIDKAKQPKTKQDEDYEKYFKAMKIKGGPNAGIYQQYVNNPAAELNVAVGQWDVVQVNNGIHVAPVPQPQVAADFAPADPDPWGDMVDDDDDDDFDLYEPIEENDL